MVQPYILTFKNMEVWPLRITEDMIVLEDIIHALSQVNRYTGHTDRPLSVAQHSVHVTQILEQWGESPEVQLRGLFHDASEAYMSDIAGPIKPFVYIKVDDGQFITYEELEDRILHVVFSKLGLAKTTSSSELLPAVIHAADKAILKIECRVLMPHATWTKDIDLRGADIPDFDAMPSYKAEAFFWSKYHELNELIYGTSVPLRA